MPPGGEPRGSPASAVGGCAAVELLEEYWYSRNVLSSREVGVPPGLPLARGSGSGSGNGGGDPSCSDATEKEPAAAGNSTVELKPVGKSPLRRSLLRTPSLPPLVGREKPARECSCTHGTGGGAKLRHSYSNLQSVLLFSQSGSRRHLSSKSAPGKHGPRRDAKVESIIRYVDGHHRVITGETRRGAFQVKKWRSLGDLETEEVQGLRDLGFVFDEEAVNTGMLQVVPGLRRPPASAEEGSGGVGEEDAKAVRRPYLSEAWLVQRSAPPALDWVGGGSAADVKEDLRFWARVVASNVHQKC